MSAPNRRQPPLRPRATQRRRPRRTRARVGHVAPGQVRIAVARGRRPIRLCVTGIADARNIVGLGRGQAPRRGAVVQRAARCACASMRVRPRGARQDRWELTAAAVSALGQPGAGQCQRARGRTYECTGCRPGPARSHRKSRCAADCRHSPGRRCRRRSCPRRRPAKRRSDPMCWHSSGLERISHNAKKNSNAVLTRAYERGPVAPAAVCAATYHYSCR